MTLAKRMVLAALGLGALAVFLLVFISDPVGGIWLFVMAVVLFGLVAAVAFPIVALIFRDRSRRRSSREDRRVDAG